LSDLASVGRKLGRRAKRLQSVFEGVLGEAEAAGDYVDRWRSEQAKEGLKNLDEMGRNLYSLSQDLAPLPVVASQFGDTIRSGAAEVFDQWIAREEARAAMIVDKRKLVAHLEGKAVMGNPYDHNGAMGSWYNPLSWFNGSADSGDPSQGHSTFGDGLVAVGKGLTVLGIAWAVTQALKSKKKS
jgi:hypothetical protein